MGAGQAAKHIDGNSKVVKAIKDAISLSGKKAPLKRVRDPFDPSTLGKLKANARYTAGKKGTTAKYVYTTDAKGRLKTVTPDHSFWTRLSALDTNPTRRANSREITRATSSPTFSAGHLNLTTSCPNLVQST